MYRIRDDVAVGYPVNLAMKQTNLFPHMVIQMTAIGEEAGALDTMLFKVAEYYEQEVNNAVDALSSLLEPMIMVILGILIGGIVGVIAYFWFRSPLLSLVITMALIINFCAAATAGVLLPLLLKRMNIDPAVAGTVVVTAVTDVMGFFSFLGLATLILMH